MVVSGGGGQEESQASARGGLAQQDDKEMIKPTEKIDKRAKQPQLCKVGWDRSHLVRASLRALGGLGSPAELMTYPAPQDWGLREAHTSFLHPPGL